jgi:hypothetical protein
MVVALKPLHDHATIKRVVVATYQSVSGAGKDAMDELWSQTKGKYVPGQEVEPKKFPKEIAFNCIPQIDVFMEDGYTKEEWKMVAETKKILDPRIKVTATCVRVPVFVSHCEAVNVEFEKPISADEARSILREAPGCLVIDKREPGGYITPMEAAGEDATYISRIREDATVENGLSMWVVSDNLRKGAALNTVQIAELMINRKLLKRRLDRRHRSKPSTYRKALRPCAWRAFSCLGAVARQAGGDSFCSVSTMACSSSMNCSRCLPGSASRMRSSTRLAVGSAVRSTRTPFIRQLDGVGPRIFLGATTLEETFALHAANDVSRA